MISVKNKFSHTCFHVLCNICADIVDVLGTQIRRLRREHGYYYERYRKC